MPNTNDVVWMVIRQDTNGELYLIEGAKDLTEIEADSRIGQILGSHTKPHKMDYMKRSYFPGTFRETAAEHGIRY